MLGKMLKENSVLKELDLSDNYGGYGGDPARFAQELAIGIKDNGAMTGASILQATVSAFMATWMGSRPFAVL